MFHGALPFHAATARLQRLLSLAAEGRVVNLCESFPKSHVGDTFLSL
jgi:hypothetical protein